MGVWAAPSALFSGDASEWAARLRDMGLRMGTGARARSLGGQYIDSRDPVDRAICTTRVGWHGTTYVLPSRSIGSNDSKHLIGGKGASLADMTRHGLNVPPGFTISAVTKRGTPKAATRMSACLQMAGKSRVPR